mmetsp:Transcript_45273/g.125534  ORF Transcript_45273/g.125534 Transcript_45273/m.125534 type:complete len:242 (+) Transcript_45273:225-950(+)
MHCRAPFATCAGASQQLVGCCVAEACRPPCSTTVDHCCPDRKRRTACRDRRQDPILGRCRARGAVALGASAGRSNRYAQSRPARSPRLRRHSAPLGAESRRGLRLEPADRRATAAPCPGPKAARRTLPMHQSARRRRSNPPWTRSCAPARCPPRSQRRPHPRRRSPRSPRSTHLLLCHRTGVSEATPVTRRPATRTLSHVAAAAPPRRRTPRARRSSSAAPSPRRAPRGAHQQPVAHRHLR